MIISIVSICSAVIALITACITVKKYFSDKAVYRRWKEFHTYHILIKELVEPKNNDMYLDRQTAVIFELRNYSNYKEHTLRVLRRSQDYWKKQASKNKDINYQTLIDEAQLTIDYLENKED